MKKTWILIFLIAFALNPVFVLAHDEAEHTDHVMTHHHEHGEVVHEHHAAILKEAASIVRASHPDLAKKLDEIANGMTE